MNRRRFLKSLFVGAIALPGTALAASYIEASRFDVSRHEHQLKGLRRPLRLVQLSDLHFGRWHHEEAVRVWVNETLRERPELIVITGDIFDRAVDRASLDRLARELSRLQASLGVWAVPGNHDYPLIWQRGMSFFGDFLERAGVKLLLNRGVQLRDDLYLAGVDDLWHGRPDLPEALAGRVHLDRATLLLSHNPDLLPDVPDSVGLTLCGHTHGGQIRAPFGIGLHSVSRFGERFQMGFVHTREDDDVPRGFVSRGLGTSGVPLRSFCSAELVVLSLRP